MFRVSLLMMTVIFKRDLKSFFFCFVLLMIVIISDEWIRFYVILLFRYSIYIANVEGTLLETKSMYFEQR